MALKYLFPPWYVYRFGFKPLWYGFKGVMFTPLVKTKEAYANSDWKRFWAWGALATYVHIPGSLPATAGFALYHGMHAVGFGEQADWAVETGTTVLNAMLTAGEIAFKIAWLAWTGEPF